MSEHKYLSPEVHFCDDGEAAIIECLAAGEPFVFDPATNFLHADDGTVEGGIRYVPAVLNEEDPFFYDIPPPPEATNNG